MEILDYLIFFIFISPFFLILMLPFIIRLGPKVIEWILGWGMFFNGLDSTYCCPNCGKTFRAKWYQMLFGRAATSVTLGYANIKCPYCNIRDACKRIENGQSN